jgi:hypothetical protein
MSTSELILEVLKYTVPAGFVLGGVGLVMREYRQRAESKERYGILQKTFAEMVPLRLQAYERAIIFLERIRPESLVIRADGSGKTAKEFQRQMIMEVREEYEHNIAQQLYIKGESWVELVRAKEQVLALVNSTAGKMPPKSSGVDLARNILQEMTRREIAPVQTAIRSLKMDIQQMFRF